MATEKQKAELTAIFEEFFAEIALTRKETRLLREEVQNLSTDLSLATENMKGWIMHLEEVFSKGAVVEIMVKELSKLTAISTKLGEKIKTTFNNEIINKMDSFYQYRQKRTKRVKNTKQVKPTILVGDAEETLKKLPEQIVQMAFTSPPYYNAREYSDYRSYKEYLQKMKNVFLSVSRVLEDGRFFIINISPVITKRPGREFESI